MPCSSARGTPLLAGKSVDETFTDVQEALSTIGEVKNADETTLTIAATGKYGLQRVRLKVKIAPQGKTSTVSISGFSEDIGAGGAKKVIGRLLDEMDDLGDLDYNPGTLDPPSMAFRLIGVALMAVATVALMVTSVQLTGRVFGGAVLIVLGLLGYFIVARVRFRKKQI